MRIYIDTRVPLFLLPALLLTSNIFPIFCHANDMVDSNKRQAPTQTPHLTPCAKSCRTEFFRYCQTKAHESLGPAKRKRSQDAPGHHHSNNIYGNAYMLTFRKCMCSNPKGLESMNSCSERCNHEGTEKEGVPDQVVELETWWQGWCESRNSTTTTSKSPIPTEPGSLMQHIGSAQEQGTSFNDQDQSGSATPTPNPADDRDRGIGYSVALFIAGAASMIFLSAFILLGYIMLIRRNQYARKRGFFAWLRLKLLGQRGYNLEVDTEYSGSSKPIGPKRVRTTAMKVRVTNGRLSVVGNQRWLNKAVPPLPPQRQRSVSAREVVKEFRRDEGNRTPGTWGLFRPLRGIMGGGQPSSNGYRQRKLEQSQGRRRSSHRYSIGWRTATSRYIDKADEEGEDVQEYFRRKGITRPASSVNLRSRDSGSRDDATVLWGATPTWSVFSSTYTQPEGANISEVEKGYAWESTDDEDEEHSHEHGDGATVEKPSIHVEGVDSSDYVGRASPSQTEPISPMTQYSVQTDIPDMPVPRGTSRTGMEANRPDAVGDLNPTSSDGQHENPGNADESFEEVDLSEGVRRYDDHNWSATDVSHDHRGEITHDPDHDHPLDSHHNSDSDSGLKPSTGKHRWRIGGKGAIGFRGLKRFGKRNPVSGDDHSDSGRGSYKII